VAALQSLAQQVSQLQADNNRLRDDNDRLNAEVARIRALMHQIGEAIAQQASRLLAGTEH
jgi:cell division protein FtsB